ncbi:substrate-binding domain-containing protein [Gracilibacillus dipsosauri]|uniref:GntR family transcriptional regulator n=1 Tax=Gracilibacillus dipsosauri TaxID=178340 RepID=A0A317L1A5_9BACI|nr:GntR family transcriptional regulator [Gracilibacillus dipsosauri]PWU69582.1 GntR family transcriptional regulator [Gracilibacillus dipsosauri]
MNKKPMYEIIYKTLKEQIINDKYPLDKPLPTQIEIAKMFNTSEITSRRALVELATDGIITRIRGKGSFVNPSLKNQLESEQNKITKIYYVHTEVSFQLLSHRFYVDLLEGIHHDCEKKNIKFEMWNYHRNGEPPNEKGVGLIILNDGKGDGISLDVLDKWKQERRPLITSHFYYPHLEIPYVVVNNVNSGYLATQHLIAHKHHNIGIILTGDSLLDMNQEFMLRLEGYKLALSHHQILFRSENIQIVSGEHESEQMGFEGMKRLLALNNPPTAVVATSDLKAFGAIEAIKDAGLSVPEDISVVGIDDLQLSKYYSPALTTINQNSYTLGKRSVELLEEYAMLDKNNNKELIKDEIYPKLIVRDSTKMLSEIKRSGEI